MVLFNLTCQLNCKYLDEHISGLDTAHMEISKHKLP